MRQRVMAWAMAVGMLSAGVPCGPLDLTMPDCCAGHASTSHAPDHGKAPAGTHAGHGQAALATHHAAAPSTSGVRAPFRHHSHHQSTPLAECCLDAPAGSNTDGPRLGAQAFALALAPGTAEPIVAVGAPDVPLPHPDPPKGGPRRHLLLSTFLI